MADKIKEFDFELNLNFEGTKNPAIAFSQMAAMYEKLLDIDRNILYNVFPSAKIEYELTDIQYGSILSKIAQRIKGIPDDFLIDITNPMALVWAFTCLCKTKNFKGC